MNEAVSPGALSTLFTDARTHNGWRETPVSDETLREIYALMKWGPTSANCSPARIVFIRTAEGKERLRPALSSGNLQKTLTAPVTAIVAWDSEFYERLPQLFPHGDARSWLFLSIIVAPSCRLVPFNIAFLPYFFFTESITSCSLRSFSILACSAFCFSASA